MTVPFVDAGMSEVLARVFYRWVEREWRRWGKLSGLQGQAFVVQLERDLPGSYFGMLRTHARALSFDMSRGLKAVEWRDAVILRSRAGKQWRQCLMPIYKANRGGYPRVTNRGVAPGDDVLYGRGTKLPKVQQRDQ